jgi:pseudouridine kinase
MDRVGILRSPSIPGTSGPGDFRLAFGGVARNVAENLRRLGHPAALLTLLGDDDAGRPILRYLNECGVDTSMCIVTDRRNTASHTAILEPHGELLVGLTDMDIYEDITPALIEPHLARLREFDWWFLDANLPPRTMEWLLAHAPGDQVVVDVVSMGRAERLRPILRSIPLLVANVSQAASIAHAESFIDARQAATAMRSLGARAGIITAGPGRIAVWQDQQMRAIPVVPSHPRNVIGAGDALVAGTLHGLLSGRSLEESAACGLAAAAIAIEAPVAHPDELTAESLEARMMCVRA